MPSYLAHCAYRASSQPPRYLTRGEAVEARWGYALVGVNSLVFALLVAGLCRAVGGSVLELGQGVHSRYTGEPVQLPPRPPGTQYHLFLSHV